MPMRHGAVVLLLALIALAAFFAWPGDVSVDPTGPAPADAPGQERGDAAEADAAAPEHAGAADAAAASTDALRTTASAAGSADDRVPWMRVRVVDPDGAPIEEATVQTFADTAPGERTTDVDGWCTLPVRAEGASLRLSVRAGERHRQSDSPRLRELRVQLPWYGPLQGRLVDEVSMAPIAGATIERPHNRCDHCEPDKVRTGADGSFVFASLPRGEDLVFHVRAEGYPVQYETLRLPGRGDSCECTLRARRGEAIAGRCVDAETLLPIGSAKIDREHAVAADGTFRLLVLRGTREERNVTFAAEGWLTVTYPVRLPQPDPTVEYRLPRAATVTGTVRTPTGTPVEGANVRVHRDYRVQSEPQPLVGMPAGAQVEEHHSMSAKTDATGRWQVVGLRPGLPYMISAAHPLHAPLASTRSDPVVATREGVVVDLVLSPLGPVGAISGIYLCNGTPSGAEARWKGPTREGWIRVHENGSFRAEHVECGDLVLTFLPDRFEGGGKWRTEIELRREVRVEPEQTLELRLEHTFEEGTIRGTLRHVDGTPAAKRTVWAREPRTRATSGEDGCYELRIPAGVASVQVSAGGEPKLREAAGGTTGVDFIVAQQSGMRYRLVDENGRPCIGGSLFVRSTSSQWFSPGSASAPDPEGYRERPVAQGRHLLLAVVDGREPVMQEISVGTEPLLLTLRMPAGSEVSLRPAAATEAPPQGLSVRVHEAMFVEAGVEDPRRLQMVWGLQRDVPFAPGGTLRGVSAGRHRLIASDPEIEIVPAEIDVAAGTSPTFELRWRRKQR